jgi:thioredoxin-related protein
MITCIIMLFAVPLGCGERERADSAINSWVEFNEGMTLAAKEGKPVVVDFYTSWCKWCKVMDEKTFSRPEIARYLNEHFVSIRLNAESKSDRLTFDGRTFTPVELTRHFGIRGFPSLAYLDTEGKLITVVPGYIPPETFLPMLKYIHKECYKQQMSFEEFMKRQEDCTD